MILLMRRLFRMPVAGPCCALGCASAAAVLGSSGRRWLADDGSRAMHIRGVGQEMPAADPMVDTDFGAAQPREERFGLVGAGAVFAPEFDAMIDALHREAGMQDVPGAAFVRMDGCPLATACGSSEQLRLPCRQPTSARCLAARGRQPRLALAVLTALVAGDRLSGSPAAAWPTYAPSISTVPDSSALVAISAPIASRSLCKSTKAASD